MNEIISNSSGNILDLAFSNTPDMAFKIYKFPHTFSTDHTVLFFFFIDFIKPVSKKTERTVYNNQAVRFDLPTIYFLGVKLCKFNVLHNPSSSQHYDKSHYSFRCIIESKHFTREYTFNVFIDYIKPVYKKAERTLYNYQAARFDLLKLYIIEDDFCSFVESSDVKDAWSKWIQMVEEAMKQAIPCVKIKENGSAPWFDCEIRHLHNVKMTDWRRTKSSTKQKNKFLFKKIRR